MGTLIGGILACYLIYLIFALIFKHKVGFIITAVIDISAGLCDLIYAHEVGIFISSLLTVVLIAFIKRIQIRNK